VYKVFRGRKYGGEPLPVVIDDVEAQISEAAEDAMETTEHFLVSQKEDVEEAYNSLEHAKEILFKAFHFAYEEVLYYAKLGFAFALHILVIVMRFIRDITDVLYSKARNFFLYSASREKDTVSQFWHTLKEYKKEADKEKEE
jgi:hypothetical protein